MGTRNLTMVIKDKETKVAQYGQWDGYPNGQGATILEFLSNNDLSKFKEKLKLVRFETKKDIDEKTEYLKSIGSTDGYVNTKQSDLFNEKYPFGSRNIGGKILELINKVDKEIVLRDASDFAKDGLMNEWTYVVDLDKNTFEVYEGFGKDAMNEDERFYSEKPDDSGYYPVSLTKSYSLDKLPTQEEFIADFVDEEN